MYTTGTSDIIIGYEELIPTLIGQDVSAGLLHLLSGNTQTPLVYFSESRERYSGIDFDYYRTEMTPYEFRAYIDFIGEESFESDFEPSDFDIYYPEDEE